MSKVKVGIVQMSCTADKQSNLQKAITKIREAAAKGAQIVCLQELFTFQFVQHLFATAANNYGIAVCDKSFG